MMNIKKVPRFYNKAAGDAFCMDDCVCTYAHYNGAEYRLIHMNALRTTFEIAGEEIISSGHERFSDIKNMTGISIEEIKLKSNDNLKDAIKNQLENGNIVAIGLKAYYCPWDWRYKEEELASDGGHEFFIVDVNDKNEEFICVDPYYEEKNVSLPFDCCIKGCIDIRIYKYENQSWDNEYIVLRIDQEKEYWDKSYENLNKFSDNLDIYVKKSLESMNTEDGIRGTYAEISNDIVYYIMEDMANNRIRFAWFLEFLKERCIIKTDKFLEDFIDISKMWNTIKKIYVKNLYRGRTDAGSLRDKIKEICTYERGVLDELLLSIHNSDFQEENTKYENLDSGGAQFLIYSVNKYFNNKGILGNDGLQADFNGFGECFEATTFPQGQTVYYKNVPFIIENFENKTDNIMCKKQDIELPLKKYSKICFLACSDWEECKDIFQLKYADGTVENKLLDICEWVPDRNRMQDNVCIIARKTIKYSKADFEKSYIYYYELICDYNKELTSIRLPNCESIHIFAITLADVRMKTE